MGMFEPLCSIRLNGHFMTKLECVLVDALMLILQAQLCGCISAHQNRRHGLQQGALRLSWGA